MSPSPVLAVISVLGKDQKGAVASFATFLAERGVNIEDIEQKVVRGFFVMDMLVDLRDLSVDLSDLVTGLLERGRAIDMEVKVVLQNQRKPKRVALLCSKEPHCLERLLADFKNGHLHGQPAIILSNHPDLEPLAKAANIGFDYHAVKGGAAGNEDPAAHFAWLEGAVKKAQVDLVVLARYMRILPPAFVQAHPSKIINIHPSLLPFFPGAAPYKQAFDSGVRVHGCTAHFVTEQLDQGPVILQDVFHINVGTDSLEDVKRNGLDLEAITLSKAVQLYLDEELVVVDNKVIFKPGIARFLRLTPNT